MSLSGQVYGSGPFGDFGDGLEVGASTPPSASGVNARVRLWQRLYERALARAGQKIAFQPRDGAGPINMRAGIRTVDPRIQLVGDVLLTDYSFVIPAKPLAALGVRLPLKVGDLIQVYPDTDHAHVLRIHVNPQTLGVDDTMIVFRGFARGGV